MTPRIPALPADPTRPPWRALALLTLLVAIVHLAVLGLAPTGQAPAPLPLENTFSTRTIVIAPPPAAAPPAAAPTPRPAARPTTRTIRPRPAPAPAPAPMPQEEAPPSPEPAEAPPAPAEAAAETGDAGGSGQAAGGTEAGTGAGADAGTPGATRGLRVPGSVQLSFAVTGQQGPQPLSGVFGELVWLQDGDTYNARLSLTLLFRTLRTETSTGRIGPGGIEPERFTERRRNEASAHFVRESGEIVFSSNVPRVALQPGAQDRLSAVMQLAALLAGEPERHPQGTRIDIQMAGPRKAALWTFDVEGEEALTVPAGDFVAHKLSGKPANEDGLRIEFWLAPALGYLPVRMRWTQSDDVADMQLRHVGTP